MNLYTECISRYTVLELLEITHQVELEAWDSWGGDDQNAASAANHASTNSSNQHGYQSNHLHRNKNPEPEQETDVDFFEDMQPHFKKPKKVCVCISLK